MFNVREMFDVDEMSVSVASDKAVAMIRGRGQRSRSFSQVSSRNVASRAADQ